MAKAAIHKKETLFTSKSDLNLRKKLVNCYILSIILMVLKPEDFRMYIRISGKISNVEISWADSVKNEVVLHRVTEE
jgi:hypothetical protein